MSKKEKIKEMLDGIVCLPNDTVVVLRHKDFLSLIEYIDGKKEENVSLVIGFGVKAGNVKICSSRVFNNE